MSCCRATVRPRRPQVPLSRASEQSLDSLRFCQRVLLERTQLMVTLISGRALLIADDPGSELSLMLNTTTGCTPAVRTLVQEIATIYSHAIANGTLQRIQAAHGNARVSINFISQYR